MRVSWEIGFSWHINNITWISLNGGKPSGIMGGSWVMTNNTGWLMDEEWMVNG